VQVIAVSAPNADPADVERFARDKYGDAPVTIYTGTTGDVFMNVGGGTFPEVVFFDADGQPAEAPPGWPGA
jgi:hypothetical protein